MLLITSLLVLAYTQSVLCTASITLPDFSNCADQAVLTCTSTDCNISYVFMKDGIAILNQVGLVDGSPVNKYTGTLISNSQAQLTIRNIELSDNRMYSCYCRFDQASPRITLQYKCEARTSTPSVTTKKQLMITVDNLYPQPSMIVVALTNPTTQVPGSYTCVTSPTLAFHYMCTWMSTASLTDGDHSYTIGVTTGIQVATLSNSYRIATPTSPTISNLVTIFTNRQVLRGIQDTLLTIQCMSSGGIPAPTLAWYRSSTSTFPLAQSSTSDAILQSDGTYTVTLTYSFTPSREDDLTPFLCRVFYPGATTEASPDPSPASALFYLDLKPDGPTVLQTEEAVSEGSMTLRCISTNGRPAPNITWFFRHQTLTPTSTLIYVPTSETYTVESVLQKPVTAVDNGQTVTCKVSHTTLSAPLNVSVTVDVKFGPSKTIIYGNQATPATGNSKIRLNCTSGSSNPASDITWYNGSDVISNEEGNRRWFGVNNGIITSNILTIIPTRYMDGDRIRCETDNGFGSDSHYVDLDIHYSPLIQLPTNITAVEGEPRVLLTCSAASNPPANFTWYYGTTVLNRGMGTLTVNSFSHMLPHVNRTDAGKYNCQAVNNVGSPDSRDIHLYVKHLPTVYVSTAAFPTYSVTCVAEGYPDSYTYQDWVQVWPGYGPVATIPFNGTTLTLSDGTYERTGVYVCAASNGVAVYGTNVTFAKGNSSIIIKAPPVFIDPSPDGKKVRVAGILGKNATTEIKYWSNVDGSVVRCYKVEDSFQATLCSVTETATNVTLRVFNHNVTETGTLATIKIPIHSKEDFADYEIYISSNVQGNLSLGITIVEQGPPTTPVIMGNFSITPGHVILTVVPGFHGGYNQTLVVQISTDLTTWINETYVYVGQDNGPTDVHLADLKESTLHYIRVFAYNRDGESDLSSHLNFNTIEGMSVSDGQSSVALIAGVVVGVCVPVMIGVALFIMWRLRRGTGKHSRTNDIRKTATNCEHSDTVECAMYVSAAVIQTGSSTCDLYSKPKKKDKPQVSSDVYAVVNKRKKDVYENAPESFKNGDKKVLKKPKAAKRTTASGPKNISTNGLIYAELEFNIPKRSKIHGLDDVTTYVQVDFTKAADPLPDSDEETSAEKYK